MSAGLIGEERICKVGVGLIFPEKHPEVRIPAYSLVTFSPQIGYSEAMRRSQHQRKIMDEIMQRPHVEDEWDSADIKNAILQKITKYH